MDLGIVTLLYIMYGVIGGIAVAIVFGLYVTKRKKALILFLSPFGNTLKIIGQKYVPLDTKDFTWNKKRYFLDTKEGIIINTWFYTRPVLLYEANSAKPLRILPKKEDSNIDASEFENFVNTQIFNKLLHWQTEKLFLIIIVVLIIGTIAISAYFLYTINGLNAQIANMTATIKNYPPVI